MLSKACKLDNFESCNSKAYLYKYLRLSLNFVDSKSSPQWNSPGVLGQFETNLDDSIDSGSFSVRGYLPLNWKDSSTHMMVSQFMWKEGIPFARHLSLKDSAGSYLCFRLDLLHSVSYFFFLYQPPSSSLSTVFDSILSKINEVLSVYTSANAFVFGDFNVHHKDLEKSEPPFFENSTPFFPIITIPMWTLLLR